MIDLKLALCSILITASLIGTGPGRFASVTSVAMQRRIIARITVFLRNFLSSFLPFAPVFWNNLRPLFRTRGNLAKRPSFSENSLSRIHVAMSSCEFISMWTILCFHCLPYAPLVLSCRICDSNYAEIQIAAYQGILHPGD